MRMRLCAVAGALLVGWACGFAAEPVAERPAPKSADKMAKDPWVQQITPKAVHYVAPDGKGAGATAQDPMSAQAAFAAAKAGDLFWFSEGTYPLGNVKLTNKGTWENPIIYRAVPGKRVTVNGRFDMSGAYNWVWGFEVIEPTYTFSDNHAIQASSPGCHIINNVIHNSGGGIGGWANGPDHIYYGNIIYGMGGDTNPERRRTNYPTYTQSDYFRDGWKGWIQNMFFDGRPYDSNFNFHGYTTNGCISGFYITQNIVANGRFLIGGVGGEMAHHDVIVDNYFYSAGQVQFGYKRPVQVEVRDNYLAKVGITAEWIWGEGEVRYKFEKPPSIFTGNTIIAPPGGLDVSFRTSAYLPLRPGDPVPAPAAPGKAAPPADRRAEGEPKVRDNDVFDNNVYSAPFRGNFFATGKKGDGLSLDAWRKLSTESGKEFDEHSKEVALPTENKVAVIANAYEPGRGHVVIFNWSKGAAATVDLSPILAPGAAFEVHHAKDAFGAPLASGKYNGPVQIPTGGKEFLALLVTSKPADAK